MFRVLFLGNGWADCVELWYALGDTLVTAYAVVTGEISLHVRTCRDIPKPRFCISGTAWPIVFKFGMWVGSVPKLQFCLGDRVENSSHKKILRVEKLEQK